VLKIHQIECKEHILVEVAAETEKKEEAVLVI
jgi:hypothetical protein